MVAFLVLFSVKVYAAAPKSEAGVCMPGMACYAGGNLGRIKMTQEDSKRIKDTLYINSPEIKKEAERAYQISLSRKWSEGKGNGCDSYVHEFGVGLNGKKIILSLLEEPKFENLKTAAPDAKNYCPNFNQLTDAQKQMMYVVLFQGMSKHESSCDPTKINTDATNGNAYGLLQLHLDYEQKYSDKYYCPKGASKSVPKTLGCSLSMVSDARRRGENLFSKDSYWDVLRLVKNAGKKSEYVNPKAKDIKEAVSLYCYNIAEEKMPKSNRVAQN